MHVLILITSEQEPNYVFGYCNWRKWFDTSASRYYALVHHMFCGRANDVAALDSSVLILGMNLNGSSEGADLIEKCCTYDNFLEDAAPGQRNLLSEKPDSSPSCSKASVEKLRH